MAAAVHARRVELCVGLGATGGLTPSAGLVEAAVAAAAEAGGPGRRVEVHVLVRPRPGGFVLTPTDLDVQVRDVRAAVAAGASGVVVGALTPDGLVDVAAVRTLVEAADGREVTFHRAVDVVADPLAALDALAGPGRARAHLGRGVAQHRRRRSAARHGDPRARRARWASPGHGGWGVRPQDVRALVVAGVDAVHLSAKRVVADDAGPGGGGDAGYEVTDPEVARAARAALDAAR